MHLQSRLIIISPASGLAIPSLWVVVIRGISKPLLVDDNSRIALESGAVVPIPTLWEKAMLLNKAMKAMVVHNFMIKGYVEV